MQPSTTIPPKEVQEALWLKGLLKWKLWKQQEIIYEQIRALPKSTQTVVMLCARQFGKSYLGTLLAVEDCIRNPGVSVLIVGPTIKQTTDIVNQSIKNLSADSPSGLIVRSKSESRWFIGTSELLIGGFDINNATRQRGKTLYRIYIEELVDSNPDQYHECIRSDLAPALTHSTDGKIIYLTTLPKIPDHPFVIDTIPEAQLRGAFYSFTIDDNKQLTEDQKQACATRCGGVNSVEYRREYLNEMVRDQSLMVVPAYDDKVHVREFTVPSRCFLSVTIDWGGVKDMTCALLHTYDFLENRFLVLDEKVFDANTDTLTIVNSLREWIQYPDGHPRTPVFYCDAPGQIMVDLTVQHNFSILPVFKSDWLSGVNQMAFKFFEQERIYIKPTCSFLRQSLRSGTFNKNRTDFERTKSLGHCDGLAALMYGLRVQNLSNPFAQDQIPGGISIDQGDNIKKQAEFNSFKGIGPRRFGIFRGS